MRLVPKTRVSKIWGKSRSWISNMIKEGAPLVKCVYDGKFDVEHADYIRYCANLGFVHTRDDRLESLPDDHLARAVHTSDIDSGDSSSMDRVMDLKLRDIITRFGEEGSFSAWLRDLKTAEDIREKRLKNEMTERSVISREGVQVHLFGLLEELSRRLLQDGSKTIARANYAAAKSGVDVSKSEKDTRDIISKNLKKAKDGITRRLKKL